MDLNSATGLLYHTYNSLFLSLPYKGIASTGTQLALFAEQCAKGLEKGLSPDTIVRQFWKEYHDHATEKERFDLLFQFVQYIERQVVLFDSVEDALFNQTHPDGAAGSMKHLNNQVLQDSEMKAQLIETLKAYSVRLVLTAHPTQFYPGNVLGIINDLGKEIQGNKLENIRSLLMQLGKTGFVNRQKPTPLDEAASLGWYLENVFYETIPDLTYRLLKTLGEDVSEFPNPQILSLGFWPGGDRDGNPFVLSDTTLEVANRMRGRLLRCYHRDIRLIRRRLTFRGLEERTRAIERKINNTLYYPEKEGYNACTELIEELRAMRTILIDDHEGLFLEYLERFILKVRIFGFHFSSIDIRQDSRKHALVWDQIFAQLKKQDPAFNPELFLEGSIADRVRKFLELEVQLNPADFEDEFTRETLLSVQAIQEIQARNGERGCHRYIISNCQDAHQVVQVLALARSIFGYREVPLDIVPLFETIDDLAQADQAMEILYSNPDYRAHLKRRGDAQTIMLGFSDGTKDGGYLRANWSIHQAKVMLSKVAKVHDVQLTFFDGRGGPPGRGGGNNVRFYEAQGPEIENRGIQVTIQGQTVSSTYGTQMTASYHIERLLVAGLNGVLFSSEKTVSGLQEQNQTMDALAEAAYTAYLGLKNHEKFVPYLEHITPLKWYGDTNIGSRPTRRGGGGGLRFEDLRAIPFVGAWAQMKQNVPGYFGLGTAIQAMKAQGRGAEVKDLYRKSLFLQTLVENSMQSLRKSNFQVSNYLADNPEFGAFWHVLNAEYQRTLEELKWLTDSDELLKDNPGSVASIEAREQIVLPLIIMQQFALQHLHGGTPGPKEELYRKLVLRAMFGIINAARNAA
jgi:phosphoenolpyruvate carboxylase